jgi:hypothetical protein
VQLDQQQSALMKQVAKMPEVEIQAAALPVQVLPVQVLPVQML